MSDLQTLSRNTAKPTLWKQGTLLKREKGIIRTTWKERFVILFEGSLFYYQASTDLTPRGVILLQSRTVEEAPEKKVKRKLCFSIIFGKEEHVFACADDADLKSWIASILENLNKVASPPPQKEFKIKGGKSVSIYMTSKIAETISSMGIGGKIIRELLSDDAVVVIDALKNFLVQRLGAEKTAMIEKQAISLAVKTAVFYKEKRLNFHHIAAALIPMRVLISKVIDGYEIPFSFIAGETAESIREFQAAAEKILKPVLAEKSLQKMAEIFNILCDEDLIDDLFEKKKWRECEIIATILREQWDSGLF